MVITILLSFFAVVIILIHLISWLKAKKKDNNPKISKADIATIFLSPVLFVTYILNKTLFSYQAEILSRSTKRLCVVAGRQVGKTYMLALYALWWAFVKPEQTVLIVAPTMRQSKIVYERLRSICSSISFIASKRIRDSQSETKFANGSVIHCLPAGRTGDTVRGYPANLCIFDEAAFIPDPVFTAVRPSVSAVKGTIVLSGTPYGEAGFFYDIFSGDGGSLKHEYKYVKFRIPSKMSPMIDDEFLEAERLTMTQAEFAMEYEGQFISDTDEFFPKRLIRRIWRDYFYKIIVEEDRVGLDPVKDRKLIEKLETIEPGDRIVGLDPSRFGTDETAIVVLERLKERSLYFCKRKEKVYKVVWSGTKGKTSIPEAADWGKEIVARFGAKCIVVDATGLGGGVFDILYDEFDDQRLLGVDFGGPSRKAMYHTLKLAIEKENIIICQSDLKMIKQFGNYKHKQSDVATGEMRIMKDPNGHDDLVDALALSLWGFENGSRIGVVRTPKAKDVKEKERDVKNDFKLSALGQEMEILRKQAELELEDEDERKKRKRKNADIFGI